VVCSGVGCGGGFANGFVPDFAPGPPKSPAQEAMVAVPEAYEAEEERGHHQLPELGQTPAFWVVRDLDPAGGLLGSESGHFSWQGPQTQPLVNPR
jgi:hypothetical protein